MMGLKIERGKRRKDSLRILKVKQGWTEVWDGEKSRWRQFISLRRKFDWKVLSSVKSFADDSVKKILSKNFATNKF